MFQLGKKSIPIPSKERTKDKQIFIEETITNKGCSSVIDNAPKECSSVIDNAPKGCSSVIDNAPKGCSSVIDNAPKTESNHIPTYKNGELYCCICGHREYNVMEGPFCKDFGASNPGRCCNFPQIEKSDLANNEHFCKNSSRHCDSRMDTRGTFKTFKETPLKVVGFHNIPLVSAQMQARGSCLLERIGPELSSEKENSPFPPLHSNRHQPLQFWSKCSDHLTKRLTDSLRRSDTLDFYFTTFTQKMSFSYHHYPAKINWGIRSLMQQIFLSLVAIILILPAAIEGSASDTSINNNILSGYSQVSTERRLFMQSNHTTTKAQSGATAALNCGLASSLADGLVSWVRRRDYHLLTVGRQVYSSDQRMGVKVSPDGKNWILTIRWVNPQDAGQYECQVSSHPPQALIINLSVVDAHAEILGGKERYIHSGSSLRLVCLLRDATEPPVYVFWYRGDRMINYDNERGVNVDNSREASVLYVVSVTSQDEGNYTCLPSNASPASVLVHVVKRENPAGLQQETNNEKDSSKSSASSSSISSKSPAKKKTKIRKTNSAGKLSSSAMRNGAITQLLFCVIANFIIWVEIR